MERGVDDLLGAGAHFPAIFCMHLYRQNTDKLFHLVTSIRFHCSVCATGKAFIEEDEVYDCRDCTYSFGATIILSCLHTICMDCFVKVYEHGGEGFSCPSCGTTKSLQGHVYYASVEKGILRGANLLNPFGADQRQPHSIESNFLGRFRKDVHPFVKIWAWRRYDQV